MTDHQLTGAPDALHQEAAQGESIVNTTLASKVAFFRGGFGTTLLDGIEKLLGQQRYPLYAMGLGFALAILSQGDTVKLDLAKMLIIGGLGGMNPHVTSKGE